VTYGLILANVLVWVLYQLPDLQGSVDELAYHPCEVTGECAQVGQGWLVTAVTSMFMHGGWEHLLGNMLFLWIFGNNIEDALGHARFLLFYLCGGFAATALQTVVTLEAASAAEATIPNVGASGAVSAVLGAYLVLLPTAGILTIIVVFLKEVPAIFFLGFWFLFQLYSGGASLEHPQAGGGVAFFAHVGGFVFGAALVKLVAVHPPLRPRRARW
jgi:membrane associated rhomboid family serine protease